EGEGGAAVVVLDGERGSGPDHLGEVEILPLCADKEDELYLVGPRDALRRVEAGDSRGAGQRTRSDDDEVFHQLLLGAAEPMRGRRKKERLGRPGRVFGGIDLDEPAGAGAELRGLAGCTEHVDPLEIGVLEVGPFELRVREARPG